MISSKISQIQPVKALVSSVPKPRRLIAGVPKRKPLVTNGERGSLGTEFLLTVICALPKAASASLPVISLSINQVIIGDFQCHLIQLYSRALVILQPSLSHYQVHFVDKL